ncbi:MAG: hypothetical protein K2U26_16120 [Cyclobacteriaceae bacterium]|nr:hypothetical protein [Cyclobacteriaceae bacterium]
MDSFAFWKNWSSVYKKLFWIVAGVFVLSLAVLLYSFLRHPAPVFTWQQFQELKQQPLPIFSFDVGGFDLTTFTDNYVLFERWQSNLIAPNIAALDVYLVFIAIAWIVLFSCITVLSRFWFFIAAGIAVFALSSFQFEALQIGGLENKIPTVAIVMMLLGLSLYFQYFHQTASFLFRVMVFTIAFALLALTLVYFSQATHPLRYLAVNTLPASIALVIVFIAMVAHETIAAFVWLVGQSQRNSGSLRHFLIISAIYLLNVWLAYWNKIGWTDWDFTLPPILLLIISAMLGVWGIRQRRPQYQHLVPDGPLAVYFIISLATIAFAAFGYFFASANDVALLSLNDLIIYTHIGYGMMFLVYVVSNYLGMLAKDLPVYKILYKPTAMPYFSFRLAGLIFTLAFVFYNSWMAPVNHFVSTYYTALGDHFAAEENATLALGYYKRAHIYSSYNQHAVTALAQLEAARNKKEKERDYLADANQFKPTEFTLVNSSTWLHQEGKSLEEALILQEAMRLLPTSGIISNNLGLTYARLGLTDSAYQYFSQAQKAAITRASGSMNVLGLMADQNLPIDPDSVFQLLSSGEPRVMSNALAIANRQGKVTEMTVTLPPDSLLNLFSASMIGNYLTNHHTEVDTSFLSACIAVAAKEKNSGFREMIWAPAAHACYAHGQVNRAFQLLQQIIFAGSNTGKHATTLALWSLHQGKPDVAASYLSFALEQKSSEAALANAVTLAETGNINSAIVAWDTLGKRNDTLTRNMAESMKRVLAAQESWLVDFTEKEKYQYLRYRVATEDSIVFNRVLSKLQNEDLKARAILDRSKKYFELDKIKLAAIVFKKLQGLHLTDTRLFADIKYFELRLLAAQGEHQQVQEQIQKGILFGPYRETEFAYYEALRLQVKNDTTNMANTLDWLAQNNPYFDEGIVLAATFFKTHGRDKRKSYRILSEALQVNPNSIKILKAYIPEALANGYDDYAASALATLKGLMASVDFIRFAKEKQLEALLPE